MNRLKREKQQMVLSLLVEGNSIRSAERITGVHRDTIIRLICRVGARCEQILDERLQNIPMKRVETDEIWTFVHTKKEQLSPLERHGEKGDQFVFIAMDAETKLIACYVVGKRNGHNAYRLMDELRKRVTGRIQLTTDAFNGYVGAVDRAFGCAIDYAQLTKIYGSGNGDHRHEAYSPRTVTGIETATMMGDPDPCYVSTSYIERQNLTLRMAMRRFTRLTNAFSKKLECLKAALALHFWHYNFMRTHGTLRMTPAMASGVMNTFADWGEILD